jgi:TonB-linked SusC/RagA family outer membrane protein
MRKILLLLASCLLIYANLAAQSRDIKGKITDEKGIGLPNASVIIKGSTIGTTTKMDGTFSLTVPANTKTLVVTAVDMNTLEIDVANRSEITSAMVPTNRSMQEVVVVGYGTQKKAELTGSVSVVKAPDLENKPFSSLDKALQGQVAGLQSVAASGQPGASQAILIRGVSSITASTAPLWVIDGVPVNTGDASRLQTTSNLLSTLNPNDVESISVLKDASAQSIYGSRAANGVIVVTTKKGRAGKTRFRFDTEVGQSEIAYVNHEYRPLNANEYFTIAKEGMVNNNRTQTYIDNTLAGLGYNNGNDFNWYEATTQRGAQQQYNLSMDGGNEKTTYYMSAGYFVQEGTTINSELHRTNGNIRLTHKATDRVTVNLNLNGGYVGQRAPLNGGAFGNPVLSSYFLLPSRSAYNPDGSWNYNVGGLHNTVALAEIDKRFLRELSLRGSVGVDVKILENLKFKTLYGGDYNTLEEDQYNNPQHGDGAASNGRAFAYYTRYYNYVWTNTLDYSKNFLSNGDLGLNAQIGYESQKSSAYFSSLQSQDFPPTLLLTYPSAGARPTTASATISQYSFLSSFASANVNFQNKYVLSGSFRRDGSSRFGAKTKYGNFWSVGASWNLDREEFIQGIDLITQLKLRASYGVNGNAGIGNYDWLPLYGYGNNYNQLPGSAPSNVGDSSLSWEINKPFNIGFDLSILKSRLSISSDYYVRKSENLLLNVPLPPTVGLSPATRNVGEMENRGIEVTLNAIPVQTKDFNWTIDFNFAHNVNKVTKLPNGNDIADGVFIIRQGVAYRTYFQRVYAGVDPNNGDPLWYTDSTRKSTTSTYPPAGARQLYGNALPKFFGSFTNGLTFKGISFDIQLYYNFGNYVYDTWGGYYLGAGFGATFNKVERVLNRWQKPGDVTDIPKYIENGNKSFQSGSTFWMNKGDFIRIRNIQVGYTLPKQLVSRANISNIFFYVRGTNVWTWVKDQHLPFDPEQGTTSSTNLNVFIPKSVTVGLNLAF